MKMISMVDFRLHSERIVRQLRKGESMTLSYRGRPLARLLPIKEEVAIQSDDPFYRFYEHANSQLTPLNNEEIDAIIYGKP